MPYDFAAHEPPDVVDRLLLLCFCSFPCFRFCVKGLTGLRGRLQALDIQVKSTEGLHLDAPCLTQHKVSTAFGGLH